MLELCHKGVGGFRKGGRGEVVGHAGEMRDFQRRVHGGVQKEGWMRVVVESDRYMLKGQKSLVSNTVSSPA